MGGRHPARMASAAQSFGADRPHRGRRRPHRRAGRPGHAACASVDGEELTAPTSWSPRRTRRSRSSHQIDRGELPDDFVDRHRALEDPQRHGEGQRRGRPAARVHRQARLRPRRARRHDRARASRSTTSRARSRTRSRAGAAALPFADICIPSVFDRRSRPRATTSCRCSRSGCRTSGRRSRTATELDAYADRVIARSRRSRPGFTASILHRQVIGPYEMEHDYGLIGGNIFHGELSPGQLFHMRPAAGLRRLPHADRRPLPGGSATHGGGGVTGIPAPARSSRRSSATSAPGPAGGAGSSSHGVWARAALRSEVLRRHREARGDRRPWQPAAESPRHRARVPAPRRSPPPAWEARWSSDRVVRAGDERFCLAMPRYWAMRAQDHPSSRARSTVEASFQPAQQSRVCSLGGEDRIQRVAGQGVLMQRHQALDERRVGVVDAVGVVGVGGAGRVGVVHRKGCVPEPTGIGGVSQRPKAPDATPWVSFHTK